MKKETLKIFSCLFFLFITASVNTIARVVIHDAPKGTNASDQYKIEIIQDGNSSFPFVYISEAQLTEYNRSKTTSYSLFSFTGEVRIRISKLSGDFKEGKILPSSYNIETIKSNNILEFTLDRPRKIAIEFDGDITHPLLLFANEPETDIPSATDPDVIFFGPGKHTPKEPIKPKAGQTVYIAAGAIVNAYIIGENAPNTIVRGRGILNGRIFGHTHGKHIFFDENSHNVTIKDITIVDAPGYYVTIRGNNAHVKNINGLGWWFNTDGIMTGKNGLIEDCFLKCNDDAIKLYNSGTEVYRTTIWQMENGAPFQISWNMDTDNSGFVVKDIDVIHCDHSWDNTNTSVFNAIHGGKGRMSNYLFEDIRIENCDFRLLSLQIRHNSFSQAEKYGNISDLKFKNIQFCTPNGKPPKRINLIQGAGGEGKISDILFENLKINGELISDARQGRFEIEPNSTANIRFKVTEKTHAGIKPEMPNRTTNLTWENPLWQNGLNSYGAKDFFIWQAENSYYLLATEVPNNEWGKRGIILYGSENMIDWQEETYLINRASINDDAWYKDGFGQPEMHKIKGKYYLVFSAFNHKNDPYGRTGICIAVSDDLKGPFTVINKDKPLAFGANTTLFVDDERVYAYWDLDGHFYTSRLDLEKAEFMKEPQVFLGPEQMGDDYRFLDAPAIFKKDKTYYLLSSSFYTGYVIKVRYFTSDSPEGPWKMEEEPLMVWKEDEADMNIKMPWPQDTPFAPPTQVVFHHHIFKGMGEKYYIAYHSSEKYSEPYLMIETIEFAENGEIVLHANKEVQQKVDL